MNHINIAKTKLYPPLKQPLFNGDNSLKNYSLNQILIQRVYRTTNEKNK